jgi:hypothetical protein
MFDERSEVREPAESQTAVLDIRGRKHMVRLANLSPSGAMMVFSLMPNIGEEVVLHLLSRGRVKGHVCWVRDGKVGVNFVASEE